MRHVNENKNMNYVPFPTIISHLRRQQTHLICSYTWNFITRQRRVRRAGFNTRGRRSRPDIFHIKIDGQRLILLNRIGAICHTHLHGSYIKSTRMSLTPLYHNNTVVLCLYMMKHTHAAQVHTLKENRRRKKTPPPSLPRSTTSPSWNLTSPERKMARLPYCRDVTVGMPLPVCRHYFSAQPNAGKRYQFL